MCWLCVKSRRIQMFDETPAAEPGKLHRGFLTDHPVSSRAKTTPMRTAFIGALSKVTGAAVSK